MAYTSLLELFDQTTDIPKIDHQFILKILMFVQHFINLNETHTSFFGGHLLGVNNPTWMDQRDSLNWLEDICGITDIKTAQDAVYEIPIPDASIPGQSKPTIPENWNVGSNLTNLSFLYIAHRIYNAKGIDRQDKDQGVVYTIIAAQIKHLCSGIHNRLSFGTNEAVAMAHFESLDNRSDLKRLGSWFALLKDRGEQVLLPSFKKQKVLTTFMSSYEVVKWANDLQDRLRKVLNGLTQSFHNVREQDNEIKSFSRMKDIEGITVVGSYVSAQRRIIRGFEDSFMDRHDLIKDNLIEHIDKTISTSIPRYLQNVLEYTVRNYRSLSASLDTLAERMVIVVFSLAHEHNLKLTQVPALYVALLNLYRSSQTKREDIKSIKVLCQNIVEAAIPDARIQVQTSTTVSFYAYLCLLIFTLNTK